MRKIHSRLILLLQQNYVPGFDCGADGVHFSLSGDIETEFLKFFMWSRIIFQILLDAAAYAKTNAISCACKAAVNKQCTRNRPLAIDRPQ